MAAMTSSQQEYLLLLNDVPIANTNNVLRNWLNSLNAGHVVKGKLLVKNVQLYDGSYAVYSLASDRNMEVTCSSKDVAPLCEDEYEWLVAIEKPIDRHQVYIQRDKFDAVKKLQVGIKVLVSLQVQAGATLELPICSSRQATVQYIGPVQDKPGRWIEVELEVKHKALL